MEPDDLLFNGTYFSNLFSTFCTFAEREPILDEVYEICRLADYLESFSNGEHNVTIHLSNFFVLEKHYLFLMLKWEHANLTQKSKDGSGIQV